VVDKAERYLVSSRVLIICEQNGVAAVVRGDTGTWRLVREPDPWRCTCPARTRCAHVEAVERVTEP
jgi:hypothetical protein